VQNFAEENRRDARDGGEETAEFVEQRETASVCMRRLCVSHMYDLWTGHLAYWTICGLVISRTGPFAGWSSLGLDDLRRYSFRT